MKHRAASNRWQHLLAIILSLVLAAVAEHHEFDWTIQEWVVDFLRPTKALSPREARRQSPFSIPDENRKAALLVNGQYPGPTIEVYENDTVSINVRNEMISEATSIHWHGVHPVDEPWMDGAAGVTQGSIRPMTNFTYKFRAWPAGTHYWHAHMDAMQAAKGLRGAFIIKKREELPEMPNYDEEQVIVLADEWRDPAVCLKLEGAMAGNDVCSDIDYASVNGQVAWGDMQKPDIKRYPYPLLDVTPGKCYRFRIIMMSSNAENYIISFQGHATTLVSLDGVDVKPTVVSGVNLHLGERADVIVCADQSPGYYPVQLTYDYACSLTPGHFIPPGFHAVSSCNFYAFLHYTGQRELFYGPPTSPKGTGGGANPKAVAGEPFDLTNAGDWHKTAPLEEQIWKAEPDHRIVVDLGLNGPTYSSPTDAPLTKGKWYMDVQGRRWSWRKPATPLLHTKGQCGSENVPFVTIPESAVEVEVILNNLSPTAHTIHLHGNLFSVINVADFQWCNVNRTDCFLMPKQVNPCPAHLRGFSDPDHTGGFEDLYWGCKFDPAKDPATQTLRNPLRKDSFQLWQRSWAVLRFKAEFPGVWQFHCHMEQHVPLGMIMALNVLPSKQKPIPEHVPTEGPCPVWSSARGRALAGNHSAVAQLAAANQALEQRVKHLEAKLEQERQAVDQCLLRQ